MANTNNNTGNQDKARATTSPVEDSRTKEIAELTEKEGRGELTTEEATRLKQLQDEADAENA